MPDQSETKAFDHLEAARKHVASAMIELARAINPETPGFHGWTHAFRLRSLDALKWLHNADKELEG